MCRRGGGSGGGVGSQLKRRGGAYQVSSWWSAGALLQGFEALDDFLHEGLVGSPLRHHFLQLGRQILKQEADVLFLEIFPYPRWL